VVCGIIARRRNTLFDDAACEGSPNPLRHKSEIVCGWINTTGAEPLRRGKFAVNFLRLEREIHYAISEASENSSPELRAFVAG
jgi:hypothetical protein